MLCTYSTLRRTILYYTIHNLPHFNTIELTPSQQKNLETVLNQDINKDSNRIKVIDRTALILGKL